MITKPIRFAGDHLTPNFATSAAGTVRVECQELDGKPISAISLADCDELFGDEISRTVTWQGHSDMKRLAGKPIRLRFWLSDADVYAFQFPA